jgi:hypothetical protein
VRLPRLSLRLALGARQKHCGNEVHSSKGRRAGLVKQNIATPVAFLFQYGVEAILLGRQRVVQLRAIAKRTVARRTEMLVDIPSATQAAEYVRHCCPLIMEALPRTTARPRARTGVRLQSSHVEAISTLAVRLFRQQFAPQLDAVEWAPRLPCSSGGSHERSAWRRRRPRRYVMPHFRQAASAAAVGASEERLSPNPN